MKKTLLISAFIALILNGCGGGSSSSSYEGKVGKADGSKYLCKSENAYHACVDGDCSSCETLVAPPKPKEPANNNNGSACEAHGSNVSVKEGQTCTDSGHTLTCNAGKVTMDGSITAQSINMNGRKYTCK